MSAPIAIAPYNPDWPERFAAEAAGLSDQAELRMLGGSFASATSAMALDQLRQAIRPALDL